MKHSPILIIALVAFIFVLANLTYAQEYADPGYPGSNYYVTEGKNELLSIEVTRSDLGLLLLGTVTNGNSTKAMIKNPVTGELSTYKEGEILDIATSDTVRIVEISRCVVLIERAGTFETIQCNNKVPTVVFNGPSTLAKYKINTGTLNRFTNNQYMGNDFITDYDHNILKASARYGVDPYLVKAVIKAESNFDTNAVSPKIAQGMMQLIPATASDYGVVEPFNPEENIEGGVAYLKDLMDYFEGDLKLTLAAYNSGKGTVIKHGFSIPPYPETTDYIARVLGYYKFLKANNYAMRK